MHGKACEPLGESFHVLSHEQRCRHDHRHLLAVLHGFERGTHRDLGLAVADVAAEKPVHRNRPLHVSLDLIDGGQLVEGLGERESVFELALPRGVGRKRVALALHARAIELDELDRDVAHRLACLALRCRPVAAAHLAQRRGLAADVARDEVELVGGNVELVARVAALIGRVLEHEKLALALHRVAAAARDFAADELDELADAVGLVHDEIASLQLQGVDDVFALAGELLGLSGVVAGAATEEL